MNKKLGKIIACASVMATAVAGASMLVACGKTDQKLDAPVIALEGNVVSWEAVEHAISYDVIVGTMSENTTDTSYTITVTETGEYKVSVVAISAGEGSGWSNSDESNELTYTVEAKKVLQDRLTLDAAPTKTVYYLDEKATELNLAGISVKAVYGDKSTKTLGASDLSVKGTVDLSTVGMKKVELEYTEGGGTAICDFRIEVKQRTVADLEADGTDYTAVENEYSKTAEKYKISGKKLTSVTDMTGKAIEVTTDDDGTYVAGTVFPKSGSVLVNADGDFLNIVAAIYVDNADDFKAINEDLDGYYILTKDINFGATELGSNGKLSPVWNNGVTTSVVGTAPLRKDAGEEGPVYELDFSGSEDLEVAGKPFTGTFDGKGYKITHALVYFPEGADDPKDRIPAYDYRAQTLSLFGYIGEGATVGNFTLASSIIQSGKNSGLIASANLGTIKNVVVDSDCTLAVRYQNSATFAAYNGGTIANCVSYAIGVSGMEEGAATRVSAVKADGAAEKNVYFGSKADNSDVLGDGWFYIDGYGMAYGNNEYNKLVSYDSAWYVGQDVKIKVYSVAGADVFTATAWGIDNHYVVDPDSGDVLSPAFTVTKSGEKGMIELTLKWANTVTSEILPANSNFVFAVGNAVSGNFGTVAITVGTPYTLGVKSISENITCANGKSINLGAVDMVVNLSDGGTKTVHPTKIEGAFDSSTDGDKEVTFVYVENDNEFKKTATVNVYTPAAEVHASLKANVDKVIIPYVAGKGWVLENVTDWTAFFDITDGEDAITGYRVTAATFNGKDVTFTIEKDGYASDSVTVDAYYGVGDKAAFNAINDKLDGWYILTDNIDFENDAKSIGAMPLIKVAGDTVFGDEGELVRAAKAFVGVFDGNGKTISRFTYKYYNVDEEYVDYTSGWELSAVGFTLFENIGEGGKVYNFTISNSAMKGCTYNSFVAALNGGTISNVIVDSSCSLGSNWAAAGAFACYNYGTIKDCTCYVTEFTQLGNNATHTLEVSNNGGGTVTNVTIQAGSPSDSL